MLGLGCVESIEECDAPTRPVSSTYHLRLFYALFYLCATTVKVAGDEVGEGTALTCKEELVHADITQQPSAEEQSE